MSNIKPKTIFTEDNLLIMRGINSECIDLIYLDPPFNSNANYDAPIGSQAEGAGFKDIWTLNDIKIAWLDVIEGEHPKLARVIHAAMTNSDKSYLIYMGIRLLEMHRILKDTGSIYLHCDPTMSHPLKMVMDSIFGRNNFRNEIIWQRHHAHNDTNRYGRIHDSILFYSKNDKWIWNSIHTPHSQEYIEKSYKYQDEKGLYKIDPLSGAGTTQEGQSGKPWHNIDPTEVGRHWSAPRRSSWPKEIQPPHNYETLSVHEKLNALNSAGLIHWTTKNKIPMFKRYLSTSPGKKLQDIITDINKVAGNSKEKTGYKTQKPLKLLDRIIKASSNEGDIVLDPFCGCATTMVAADRLNRNWIGIDCEEKAVELLIQRIKADQGLFQDIVHRTDIPKRTDLGHIPKYNCAENKAKLYGKQEGYCNGCGTHMELRHLEVDHIISRGVGGTDHIDNLQLLCGHCNRIKGDRGQEYLLARLNPQPQRKGNIR